MKQQYPDLTELTDKQPLWFDDNGVPRYRPFEPRLSPNIYADQVVLYKIRCQECHREYLVSESYHPWVNSPSLLDQTSLEDQVKNGNLHYGDPPCFECSAGATMNCEDIEIVEFWAREGKFRDWTEILEYKGKKLQGFISGGEQ